MYKKRLLSYGYPMVILWVSYGMITILALLKENEGRGRKVTKGMGWRERKVAEECGWRGRIVAKGMGWRERKVAKECGWRGRKVTKGMGWRERKEIFCKKRQMYLHI